MNGSTCYPVNEPILSNLKVYKLSLICRDLGIEADSGLKFDKYNYQIVTAASPHSV